MNCSLIITTYNRPDALALVLQSVMHQSTLPVEIILADDGSGDETRLVIDNFRKQCPVPVVHAWQEDRGFRAARVRNLAASKTISDYLIFLDGDMIMHPAFIASHLHFAKEGFFLHGKRAMLNGRLTQSFIRKKRFRISPFTPGISLWKYAFHSDLLSRAFTYESTDWYDTQSANFSVWKKDFVNVNGFNEEFEGWGREDSELALRLIRSGLKKMEIRFCAVTFHLAHGKDNKLLYAAATEKNQKLLDAIAKSSLTRCERGLSLHL